ncbi:TPA: hypothetical protein P1J72_003821 [Clostridioides difficile]|nr:hypothetical protein [Clostridioides difficile]
MDINLINNMLLEGMTVKEIRQSLGISEKKFQKEIKELGYKFNQKEKAYIKVNEPITEPLNGELIDSLKETTKPTTLTTTQTTTIDYLVDNIDLIKQLLENYKRNTQSNNTDIIINLISDKHLNPKPKSIRINEFVWRDWQEFIKDLTFNKGDLISMALKEFMENHS